MKVDHAKDENEKLLEKAVEVLSHTIPEQQVDAMKDYHKVARTLEKGTDWQFKPIVAKLQMLYMFPGRKLHNAMIVELHELLEEVRENRINQMIDNQRKKGFGEGTEKIQQLKLPIILFLILMVSIIFMK